MRRIVAYLSGVVVIFCLVTCGGSGSGGAAGTNVTAVTAIPAGTLGALIRSATQYEEVGAVIEADNSSKAAIYFTSPAVPVVLSQAGYSNTDLFDTDNQQEVGLALTSSAVIPPNDDLPYHAILFQGPQHTFTDLHPAGYYSSAAKAVNNGQQVGFGEVAFGGPTLPLLWTGSAASVKNLLPPTASAGVLNDVSAGIQVGFIKPAAQPTVKHAGVWHGTAGTFQDINPAGYQESDAFSIGSLGYVGYGIPNGDSTDPLAPQTHALLWKGSTVIDLHPAGAFSSSAYAISGNIQVGSYNTQQDPKLGRACMWKGSAGSLVDLDASLPKGGYVWSLATGVAGNKIVGYAVNNQDIFVAVVWTIG